MKCLFAYIQINIIHLRRKSIYLQKHHFHVQESSNDYKTVVLTPIQGPQKAINDIQKINDVQQKLISD